jgi:L-serine dehydratase
MKSPSIFNDVIGPVMRGPSSSHCAAAVRIGRLARDLMGGELARVRVEFHRGGSLATTHESQGSDMGLFGGLLGWDATDPRLPRSPEAIREAGVEVEIAIQDFPAVHPNTYRLTLEGPGARHRMTALSTGGGMIRVVEVDGASLDMGGDLHETLVFLDRQGGEDPATLVEGLQARLRPEGVQNLETNDRLLLRITTRSPVPESLVRELEGHPRVREVRRLAPVLPVLAPGAREVPFLTVRALQEHNETGDRDLWELAALYESVRAGMGEKEVLGRMVGIVETLERSLEEGIRGTDFQDRILGPQAPRFREAMEGEGRLLASGLLNRTILYVTALMEVKSSMGVIVAAPTAGSCGALPGVCLAAAHELGAGKEDAARAMLAAGLIGVFIVAGSTFAAEECGCQAECGAGSGMAAAALVTLKGGTMAQALGAASMALQNTLGMVCDPVANRVEVPCLGRNVLAASNALTSANMSLAGFDPVIPLDEVIETMDAVGRSLPRELRCTALGGLSVTKTSRAIEERLRAAPPSSINPPGPRPGSS